MYMYRRVIRSVLLLVAALIFSTDMGSALVYAKDGNELQSVSGAQNISDPQENAGAEEISEGDEESGLLDSSGKTAYCEAVTRMGLEYGALFSNKKNSVYCPYGIASAIGMLSAGIGEDRQSYRDIMKVFNAASAAELGENNRQYLEGAKYGSDNVSRSVSFLLVDKTNGGADGVNGQYREFAEKNYNATVRTADFRNDLMGEKQKIKKDVDTATDGFIDDYQSAADSNTDVDLMNVTYFKGKWRYPFDKKDTKKRRFTNVSGKKQSVSMMKRELKECVRYYQDKNFRAVMLPYSVKSDGGTKPDTISMVLILPRNKKDLDCVKRWNKKDADYKMKFLNKLSTASTYNEISLRLPAFEMDIPVDLEEKLKKLGLGSVFSSSAGITGITSSEMAITGAVQRTKIKVDEEGTTAAAVTELVMKNTSVDTKVPRHYNFYCNVPFVFMVRDGAGMTLFGGAVNRF